MKKMSLEGMALLFHLIVTVAVLLAYCYSLMIGHPDETLRAMLLLAGGYWYGVMQKKGIQKKQDGSDPNVGQ